LEEKFTVGCFSRFRVRKQNCVGAFFVPKKKLLEEPANLPVMRTTKNQIARTARNRERAQLTFLQWHFRASLTPGFSRVKGRKGNRNGFNRFVTPIQAFFRQAVETARLAHRFLHRAEARC
jgi:hypothetical protein